jgi:glycosyltransferase involved in cell wall biosynthesis
MSDRPVIVHLIPGLPVGGAEWALARLVRALADDPWRHIVVSMQDEGSLGAGLRADGIEVVCLGLGRSSPNPFRLIRLHRLLKQTGARLLVTWLYHADVLGLGISRLVRGLPVVWNVRCSVLADEQTRGLVALETRLLARCSGAPRAIVANSQAAIDHHKGLGYRSDDWRLIPNGVDSDLFRPDPAARAAVRETFSLRSGDVAFGLVGRFEPTKNQAGFLRAAATTARARADARFVLVGRGNDASNEALMRLIAELDLAGRVILAGERHDMPAVYNGFDAMVCASVGESFPNVLTEAMACGVPCISTDVGDAAAIVGDTGTIVPVGDDAALAAAMTAMADAGPERRGERGAAAGARILERYTVGQSLGLYRTLFAETASR